MGVNVTILEDGTVVRRFDPDKDTPMYADWLKFMLSRDLAVAHITGKVNSFNGEPIIDIVPRTRYSSKEATTIHEDGSVSVICVCCGTPTPFLACNNIRIGGIIQVKDETEDRVGDVREITIRWKRQPTMRMGLGCPECQTKYLDEEVEAKRLNREAEEQHAMRLEIAKLKYMLGKCKLDKNGHKIMETVQGPKLITPFIDVFSLPDVQEMLRKEAV